MIGFWNIVLVLYFLFLAIGPRKVLRWIRAFNRALDRIQGRPPREQTRTAGWLRAIELLEYSTPVGWACAALGVGLLVLDGVCRTGSPGPSCAFYGPLVLLLAMLLFFIAPWLI